MSHDLGLAMEGRTTRWESRDLWCQWFDAAKAAGFSDGEAARFASDKDEDLRHIERELETLRRRMDGIVNLGASTPPSGGREAPDTKEPT